VEAEDESDAGDDGEEYGSVEDSVPDVAEDGKSEDGDTEHGANAKDAGASDTNETEIKKETSNGDVDNFTEEEEEDEEEEEVQSLPDDSGTDPDYSDGEDTDVTSASDRSVQKEATFRRYKVEFPIKQENIMSDISPVRPAQMFTAMTAYKSPRVIQDACRVDRLLGLVATAEELQKGRERSVAFRRCRTLSPAPSVGQVMPGSLSVNGDQPMTD
jgi:hypothetical protein